MILDVDYPRGQSTSFLLHISLSRIAHIFYGFYMATPVVRQ